MTACDERHDPAPFIAAKADIDGLTRGLSVTVNCVARGSIRVDTEDSVVPGLDAMLAQQLDRQRSQR